MSGARFLEAFLIGFEVECKIAEAIHPNHYKKGFHSSGTIGTFGAAAAAAKLLGLDADATAHAIAIAASLERRHPGELRHDDQAAARGAGRRERRYGRRAWPRGALPAGRTRWTDPGASSRSSASAAASIADRIVGKLGAPYSIVSPGVSIKPYPCGVLGHPSMDAMRKLVIEHDVQPEQIRRIRLRAGSNILNPLRYPIAHSELEAKFCPAFMLSSIALRRKAGIHEFTDEFVRSAPVQRMMAKVQTVLDPAIEARGFEKIRSIVEVELEDGRRLTRGGRRAIQGWARSSLHACRAAREVHGVQCAASLRHRRLPTTLALLESIEDLSDLRALVRVLTTVRFRDVNRPAGVGRRCRRSPGDDDDTGLDLDWRARAGGRIELHDGHQRGCSGADAGVADRRLPRWHVGRCRA